MARLFVDQTINLELQACMGMVYRKKKSILYSLAARALRDHDHLDLDTQTLWFLHIHQLINTSHSKGGCYKQAAWPHSQQLPPGWLYM